MWPQVPMGITLLLLIGATHFLPEPVCCEPCSYGLAGLTIEDPFAPGGCLCNTVAQMEAGGPIMQQVPQVTQVPQVPQMMIQPPPPPAPMPLMLPQPAAFHAPVEGLFNVAPFDGSVVDIPSAGTCPCGRPNGVCTCKKRVPHVEAEAPCPCGRPGGVCTCNKSSSSKRRRFLDSEEDEDDVVMKVGNCKKKLAADGLSALIKVVKGGVKLAADLADSVLSASKNKKPCGCGCPCGCDS